MVHESFRGNRQNNFVTAARDPRLARKNTLNFSFSLYMSAFLQWEDLVPYSTSSSYTRYLWKRVNLTIWWLFFCSHEESDNILHSANSFYYKVVFSPTIHFLQNVTSCLSYSSFGLWRFTLKRNRPHFANKKHIAGLFIWVLSPTNFINNLVTRSVKRVSW